METVSKRCRFRHIDVDSEHICVWTTHGNRNYSLTYSNVVDSPILVSNIFHTQTLVSPNAMLRKRNAIDQSPWFRFFLPSSSHLVYLSSLGNLCLCLLTTGCSYIAYNTYCFCPGYAYSFCRPRRYSSLAVAFMSMIVLAPCRLTIFPGCWCSIPYLATLGSSSLAVVFCCALFFASIHPVYSCHWLSSPGLCDAHGSSHLIPLLLLLTSPAMADTLSVFKRPFLLFSVH